MKMVKKKTGPTVFALSLIWLVTSCGQEQQESELEWLKSRNNTERYAYLTQDDLQDEFLFGASVIGVDGFLSNALNMTIRPIEVRLRRTADQLQIVSNDRDQARLMAFRTGELNGNVEIDFASAGNDVTLNNVIKTVGGQTTVESDDGFWRSVGAPTVLGISQDENTVVVDVQHTVHQVRVGRTIFGTPVEIEQVTDRPGRVLVRLWLKRTNSLPTAPTPLRTIGHAQQQDFGFFPSHFRALAGNASNYPIQRFDLRTNHQIIFYLKDFPNRFVQAGVRAVESWNRAFGQELLVARIAPADLDVGDPRYNVIKWFNDTDEELRWAGVAKMIVNPRTGLVMGGNIYIQGNELAENVVRNANFSHDAQTTPNNQTAPIRPTGRIGGIDFSLDEGEQPVIPFLTDLGQSAEEYVQSYYLETIAHEVGHVIGLRHNFKGSTLLTNGQSASVMDYTPRAAAAANPGPGLYDIAAVRWGYFGESSPRSFPYCTDEHIDRQWDCNQSDYGDPLNYTIRGLADGTNLVTQLTIPITKTRFVSSMRGQVKNGKKIVRLRNQLHPSLRTEAVQKLVTALNYAENAGPHPSVTGSDRTIVLRNLQVLKEAINKED